MTPYLHTTNEPCEQIENWQAAEIRNDENSKTLPACWLRVDDKVEVIYWFGGMAFIFEYKPEINHADVSGRSN